MFPVVHDPHHWDFPQTFVKVLRAACNVANKSIAKVKCEGPEDWRVKVLWERIGQGRVVSVKGKKKRTIRFSFMYVKYFQMANLETSGWIWQVPMGIYSLFIK